jgi:prepilin-type processing-associated H-X9-DG protein
MANRVRSRLKILGSIAIVAAIAVVIVILLPILSRDRERRRAISCQLNLKQVGMAFKMYAADWDGLYPPKKRVLIPGDPHEDRYVWVPDSQAIYPDYLSDLRVLICPSDAEVSELCHQWQRLVESGPDQQAIRDFVDDSSYVYTGYVACTSDSGNVTVKADAQFVGFFRAIDELGWEDFDSDITFPEDQLEEYKEHTIGHNGIIYRLREGIGELLVADATDEVKMREAESEVAVMWDRLAGDPSAGVFYFNHIPGGSNVLFLDGHVEFLRYPNKFPVTPTAAAALHGVVWSEATDPVPLRFQP